MVLPSVSLGFPLAVGSYRSVACKVVYRTRSSRWPWLTTRAAVAFSLGRFTHRQRSRGRLQRGAMPRRFLLSIGTPVETVYDAAVGKLVVLDENKPTRSLRIGRALSRRLYYDAGTATAQCGRWAHQQDNNSRAGMCLRRDKGGSDPYPERNIVQISRTII